MEKLNNAFSIVKHMYEVTYTLSTSTLPEQKASLVNNTLRLQLLKVSFLLHYHTNWGKCKVLITDILYAYLC